MNWAVHVIIPVHNEERRIGDCLAAMQICAETTSAPVSVRVVLDSCTDRSAELVGDRAEIRIGDYNQAGACRAAGFADICGNNVDDESLSRVWLATTDADSQVPPSWLNDQLRHASGGADVVAGRVAVESWSEWSPMTRQHYLSKYGPSSGHTNIHGANLGFSALAYRKLGGFSSLAIGEDVDLVHRADQSGFSVVFSTDTAVVTSARRIARAPGGFSEYLRLVEQEAAG